MAKTKPKSKKDKKSQKPVLNRVSGTSSKPTPPPTSPTDLLLLATASLQQGAIEDAVKPAKAALVQLDSSKLEALPALNLLGEIHVELGSISKARGYFQAAAALDPTCSLPDGAEKFLWLAQLSEEGGHDSVGWYEKGAQSLRAQIQVLLDMRKRGADEESELEEKQRKLAAALCGVVEVYMTDLSWEADAEAKCEALVTEATLVGGAWAEPWQTLANVRLSQERVEDARAALTRSLDVWKEVDVESEVVPDFPTRVSLARLLMEAGMDGEAIEVLERLVGEDDSSVEVWYLGGWGLYVLGEKQKCGEVKVEGEDDGEGWRISWISSRQWLTQSLRLFLQQDYEDERLGEHAKELLASLNKELGGEAVNGDLEDDDQDGDDWEDDDSGEDEEMNGA